MKYTISTIALLAFCFSACNNTPATTQTEASATQAEEQVTATEPVAANGFIDPVCGMVKDDTWTDFSIYKGDTVWFCAAPEKVAFDANPTKYEKNLKHP